MEVEELTRKQVDCRSYIRTMVMRKITFTCMMCKKTITQMRSPSPMPNTVLPARENEKKNGTRYA